MEVQKISINIVVLRDRLFRILSKKRHAKMRTLSAKNRTLICSDDCLKNSELRTASIFCRSWLQAPARDGVAEAVELVAPRAEIHRIAG